MLPDLQLYFELLFLSKAPYKFWTNMSFSFIIYLFFIYRLESLSRILVICTMYSISCWNIVAILLCSSHSASSLYTNFGVWNLWVYPLELVPKEPRLLCVIHISTCIFVLVVELNLEGSTPSLLCGIGIDCCTYDGFRSKFYICSSTAFWTWDFGSFLGHHWCSCPFDLYSCLGEC